MNSLQQSPPPFPAARRHYRPSTALRDVPRALWVALAAGAFGFVLHVDTISISTIDGSHCDYTDIGAWLIVTAVTAGLLGGWWSRARRHPAHRLAMPIMAAFSVVLVVLGVYFALRGLGTVHDRCADHPLP